MRKLIVCNIISLDGFYSGPGGDVMAMPFDDGFSDYNAERLRAADTLLLGRKSYEGFRSYWPAIAEDVNQPAVEREISRLNAAIEKIVVSNGLKPDAVEGWGPTRVVRRADAHAEVAALKERPGREILMFGSHLLWNDLLANGLVDELHLMIGAGVVAEGVRAFETRPPGSLRLLDTRTFAARACSWPGMPSSADRDAGPARRTRRCSRRRGHLGISDFKLTVVPAAAELSGRAARGCSPNLLLFACGTARLKCSAVGQRNIVPGRFTVRGSFVLAVRNRLIVYGDVEDGTVSAGEELRVPLNGGFAITVTIESVETVDGTETGSHVALVVSEDDAPGYELIQGMNFTDETLVVQAPV